MPARPPITNQLTIADPAAREACGEACDAMVSQALGVDVSAVAVINALRAEYGSVADGTSVMENDSFLVSEGCAVTLALGLDGICAEIAAGQYVIALIHDNNNADPDPNGPYEHYVVVYADNGATLQCVNPWGGRDIPYDKNAMAAALIAAVAVTKTAPAVVPITGDADDMDIALLKRSDDTPDPNGAGAIYLAEVGRRNGKPIPLRKRHISTPGDEAGYLALGMTVETVPGGILDRAEDGPSITAGTYPTEA